MTGKVRLIVVIVATVAVAAGSVPVTAQQPAGSNALPAVRAGASLSSIQGTAVNWTNTALANAPVRLRDARVGRVIETIMTDRFGAFEFRGLEPGSYVAELLSPGGDAVLASTPILNVNAGESVAALLKLPLKNPPVGGAFGRSLPTALAITSAAVAAGVLATSVTGAPATDRALPGQR
jgi:hypothetical protein